MEIVTLLIPGFNDAPEELTRLTAFLAGVSLPTSRGTSLPSTRTTA